MTRVLSAKREVATYIVFSAHFQPIPVVCAKPATALPVSVEAQTMSSNYDPSAPPYAGFFGVMGASAAIIFCGELLDLHVVWESYYGSNPNQISGRYTVGRVLIA